VGGLQGRAAQQRLSFVGLPHKKRSAQASQGNDCRGGNRLHESLGRAYRQPLTEDWQMS
jgi:hypothetical protein